MSSRRKPCSQTSGRGFAQRAIASLVVAACLLPPTSRAAPPAHPVQGWRHAASGVTQEGLPPALEESKPGWRASTSSGHPGGNASPIRFGPHLCVTEEPTTLTCHDPASGEVSWSHAHEVIDALPAHEAAPLRSKLAAAAAAETRRPTLLRERSALQRRARAGEVEASARLAAVEAELGQVQSLLKELAWARTSTDRDVVGFASPTPVASDDAIFAIFSNGVLSARSPSGALRWQRWLGAARSDMKGYHLGTATSPLLVDGLLLVAHTSLHGIDPATGKDRWVVDDWRDYGTPAVMPHPSGSLLALPDGSIRRARDGELLASGLADQWYVGPQVHNDLVVWVGGHAAQDNQARGHILAVAWRLRLEGDTLRTERLWATELPTTDIYVTAPIVHNDRIYTLSRSGELRILSATTGTILHDTDLLPTLRSWSYVAPQLFGDVLLIGSMRGRFAEVRAEDATLLRVHDLPGEHLATPLVERDRAFFRSRSELLCLGC